MAETEEISLNDLQNVDHLNNTGNTNGSDNETENNCETAEENEKRSVSWWSLSATCVVAILYIADVVSDVILAIKYFSSQQCLYACLTLGFVITPSLYVWWLKNYRTGENLDYCCIFNTVIILFNLDPLFGYWKSFKLMREIMKIEQNEPVNSGCSKEWKGKHMKLAENNLNVATLTYSASCTESTLQLILQMVILLREFNHFDCIADVFLELGRSDGLKLFTIVLSFVSVAVSPVMMLRAKRIKLNINNEEPKQDDPLKLKGIIIQSMGYFLVMVTRIFAISLAVSKNLCVTIGVFVANWICVLCYLISQNTPLMYNIFQSLIYTFTPPINALTSEMIFQFVYLLQNVLAILFWPYAHCAHSDRCVFLYVILLSNITGIGFRILYRKTTENI